ncbi:monocarboxylate transporter 6-like isoform X2 [Haliotis rubra]|nr:monocarboxylate transporter 6-like isoform X2 [Haliotis rubra]
MDSLYILYLTLGVLPGTGVCIAFTASMVHVSKQFSKWRPLAVGASVSGIAVGMLVWPPLSSAVADNMGWRGTFLINGALTLHFIPGALLITPANNTGPSNDTTLSLRQAVGSCLQMFKISGAIHISFVYIFLGFSYYTFSSSLPDYLTSTLSTLTSSDAALILSTSGYGGMVSRIVSTGISMEAGREFIHLC